MTWLKNVSNQRSSNIRARNTAFAYIAVSKAFDILSGSKLVKKRQSFAPLTDEVALTNGADDLLCKGASA